MKHLVNIEQMRPDEDKRSLRHAVQERESEILRDTYSLIDPETSPSKNLNMGYTIVYPTGRTTGHSHDDREEVYFILSGRGRMVVGDDDFQIKAGDAFYVPLGAFHTTYCTGIEPLKILWVTGRAEKG